MDEKTKEKPKTNIKRMGVIVLLFFIVIIILAIILPSMVIYRPESHCERVESDALKIKAALSDYFSNAAHTDFNIRPEVLQNKKHIEHIANPWTLTVCGGNIYIHVADGSRKCTAEYQALYPEWHSSMYTLKLFD